MYMLWRTTRIPGEIKTVAWPEALEDDVRGRKNGLEKAPPSQILWRRAKECPNPDSFLIP